VVWRDHAKRPRRDSSNFSPMGRSSSAFSCSINHRWIVSASRPLCGQSMRCNKTGCAVGTSTSLRPLGRSRSHPASAVPIGDHRRDARGQEGVGRAHRWSARERPILARAVARSERARARDGAATRHRRRGARPKRAGAVSKAMPCCRRWCLA
jgi:hypothetical protein